MARAGDPCPCGRDDDYGACCGPIIAAERDAETAEDLMRSRYTAFARGHVDHLVRTHMPPQGTVDAEQVAAWARRTTWLGLEILRTEEGGPGASTGVVEFRARYVDGTPRILHERSSFARRDGRWVYVSGMTPKVSRNAPCACGSGLKFKRCCGRA